MRGSDHHGNLGTIKKVASHLLKTESASRSANPIRRPIASSDSNNHLYTRCPHMGTPHETHTRGPHTRPLFSLAHGHILLLFPAAVARQGVAARQCSLPFQFFFFFFTFYYELSSLSYFLNKNRTKKVYRDCTKKLCDELVHKKIVREIFLIKR